MSEMPTTQAITTIPMAETTISTTPESSITEHPISESCKKAKIADTTTTTIVDFISGLPDAVLCHILSYIPTVDAVATGVLSKRWSRLWTSVPNLDFSGRSRSSSKDPVIIQSAFLNFVDNVLSSNNVSCVRKVYLSCDNYCDSSHVNSWISAIASRDTEAFHLNLPGWCHIENLDQSSRIYSLPSTFFARKNLVHLWLVNIALKLSTTVYFPNLKTISFDYVQFLDDDTMKNLLSGSGCPVVWSLMIDRGPWDNAQTLYIYSSTLRSLHLNTDPCDTKKSGFKVVIEVPNVSFLSLSDSVDVDYDINNLSSLVEAEICVERDGTVCRDRDVYANKLIELFRKISHIEKLCLTTATMRSFAYTSLENLPMFNNLTSLKVELFDDHSCPILPYLFHCTPNLVTLVLWKDNVHPDCCWYEPNDVPKCFLSCLENIEVGSFEYCDAEMEMVYYFLKNVVVLKKLSIVSDNLDLETEINILKLFSIFPRSSSTCCVEYKNT